MDITAGLLGSLVGKLADFAKEEYNRQTGLSDSVESLSEELMAIQTALLKVAEVPLDQLDPQLREWASRIREASYDMEDAVDTYDVVDGVQEPPERNKFRLTMKKISSLFSCVSKGKARHDIAVAIQDIMKELDELARRRDRYKFDGIEPKTSPSPSNDPRLKFLYNDASMLVGIEKPRDGLVAKLSPWDNHVANKKMKIVCIVGPPGLGKITLATSVYDKLKVDFQRKAFVQVGQNPILENVLKEIFIELKREEQKDIAMNQQGISPLLGEERHTDYCMLQQLNQRQLIDSVRDLLKNDRYLIVVDDIWEISTWEIIEMVFVKNDPDSRIMATTRNFHVAKKIGEVYHGNRLSYEESKKLFFKRVCGSYEKVELEKESEKILKKCDGVPLTIITVAGVLAKRTISDWSTVYNSIGFSKSKDGSVEDMKRIITFSYYDLPPHLKTCLMYLSIFVEDSIIPRDQMIWLWIAEGFVKEKDHKGLFEVGEEYFHELKNSSMILALQVTGQWGCRVHDMVLQIIRDLSLEENLVTIFDYNKHKVPSKRKVRRMVLHGSWDDDVDTSPQVRSFVASGCPMAMTDPLKNFIVLRVLSLEECSGMKDHHLEHLGNLLHLRYFSLRRTPTKKLPDNIERLQFLQTLEIRGTGIKQLPENMSRLTKLMCLNADEETSVPSWIGNMTSLQELAISISDSEAGASFARLLAKELGNLTELRVLRIVIKDVQNDQVQEVESALTESLSKLHKAREIMIVFFDKNNLTHRFTTPWVVSLSTQVRILAICFQLPRLPECIHPGNLPLLCYLVMDVPGLKQRDIEILGSFPELSSIVITSTKTTLACGSGGFKNLLDYQGSSPLIFSRGAMPMLETYELHFKVSELKNGEVDFNFECGLGNLPSLRVVKVRLWCEFAHPDEVEEAEAALRHAMDVHPNRPVFQLTKSGEAKMLLTENKRREYFAASRLKRQAIVESQISAQLIREFKLVRDSVPSCHPNAPKLNSLMKECEDFIFDFALSQCEERYNKLMDSDLSGLDRHQLMDAIEFMKSKIEVLSRSNQQAAALVRELKAERALQVVSLDHPAEAVEISRLFQQLDDHWNVSLARMEEFSRVHDSAPLCHPNQWDLRTKKIFAVLFDHDFNLHHRDVMSAALECTEDIQQLMESIAALKLMIEMRAHRTQQAAALLEELKADLNLQSGDDGADKIPKSSILPTEEG